jgi:hypothetical protein
MTGPTSRTMDIWEKISSMPSSVKVPLLGNVPKGALFAGGLAAVGVSGYLLWRKSKQNAAATTGSTSYGYGATGYGESSPGYYGYNYAYGGGYGTSGMGAGVTPYPVGSEYGYGAYGYGDYNPYTGQYLGGGVGTTPVTTPTPVGGGGGSSGGGVGKPATTHTITANGHQNMQQLAKANHISKAQLLLLNPHLGYLWGSGKPIPSRTRVKV